MACDWDRPLALPDFDLCQEWHRFVRLDPHFHLTENFHLTLRWLL